MALLYRVARLHDRANTHVFTFVVTRSVTRDLERDITSKELACGFQKWAITFSRTDKVLGEWLGELLTISYLSFFFSPSNVFIRCYK